MKEPLDKSGPNRTHLVFVFFLFLRQVRTRDECFLDLSIDVEQNSSLTSCLRNFSSKETLSSDSKYFCETCCCEQEAQKRWAEIAFSNRKPHLPTVFYPFCLNQTFLIRHHFPQAAHQNATKCLGHPPQTLQVHGEAPTIQKAFLPRFTSHGAEIIQYGSCARGLDNYRALALCSHLLREPPPSAMQTDDAAEPDRIYDLVAAVVHVGTQPSRGHYISVVRANGHWLLFDDDNVSEVPESELESFFGHTDAQHAHARILETTYILFYQARGYKVDSTAPAMVSGGRCRRVDC